MARGPGDEGPSAQRVKQTISPLTKNEVERNQQDERQRASKGASRKMKLILQCVGSLPATPDLADEMNRVESAVDFIAGQEHDASEKCEILNIAAEAISVAAVAPQCTHLVVRVPGVSRMTVARAVCVVK